MALNFIARPFPRSQLRGPFGLLLTTAGFAVAVTLIPPPAYAQNASATHTEFQSNPPQLTVERETLLMGTLLRATLLVPARQVGIDASEAAFAEVRRLEAVLSSWLDDSELGRLNRAPVGVPTDASPELFAILSEVLPWTAASGGAFNPAVGPLIDAWDLRGRGRRPSPVALSSAMRRSGPEAFQLEADGKITRNHEGSWLTSGGFGKGWALRRVERVLRGAGVESALLDFGGQGLALGGGPGARGWVIGVAHPARRHEHVALLRVKDASVATSGASERFVEVGGERYGHIIDPRTGWPVPAWGSVTVVTRDPLIADILATTLFVLGPDRALDWLGERGGVGALLLRESEGGRVEARWNAAMETWLLSVEGEALDARSAARTTVPRGRIHE